jgi:exodeoxyribonuclease-1
MLFRYRARNYPETLNDAEKTRWQEFRLARMTAADPGTGVGFDEMKKRIASLRESGELSDDQLAMLNELEKYAQAQINPS